MSDGNFEKIQEDSGSCPPRRVNFVLRISIFEFPRT
jgi:hypothetical protein